MEEYIGFYHKKDGVLTLEDLRTPEVKISEIVP